MTNNFKVGDFIYQVGRNDVIKFKIKEIIPYRYIGKNVVINEEGLWLNESPKEFNNTQMLKVENIHYADKLTQTHDVFVYELDIYNQSASFGWFSNSELATKQFMKLNHQGIKLEGRLCENSKELHDILDKQQRKVNETIKT